MQFLLHIMKSVHISTIPALSSSSKASLQRSTRTITQFTLLVSLFWSVTSLPLQAQSKMSVARTEESEKCEWLGVCDGSETSFNLMKHAEEDEQCTWLGICD